MGMTLTQKILAAHAGLPEVKAGQLINAKLDIVSPIRTSRAQPSPSSAASLPTNMISSTSTMWVRWVLSTLSCPKKAS